MVLEQGLERNFPGGSRGHLSFHLLKHFEFDMELFLVCDASLHGLVVGLPSMENDNSAHTAGCPIMTSNFQHGEVVKSVIISQNLNSFQTRTNFTPCDSSQELPWKLE